MPKRIDIAEAEARLDEICDEVIRNRETIIIHRDDASDVAILPADELKSLREMAHLLKSPANAKRLLTAIHRARSRIVPPESIDLLRADLER